MRSEKKQIVSYDIPVSFNPFEMRERIIRVEEELKHQRELMIEGFKAMDKRFNLMLWIVGGGFAGTWSILAVLVGKL